MAHKRPLERLPAQRGASEHIAENTKFTVIRPGWYSLAKIRLQLGRHLPLFVLGIGGHWKQRSVEQRFSFECGGVVQLARTPARHAGGRGFESRRSRQNSRAIQSSKVGASCIPISIEVLVASHYPPVAFEDRTAGYRPASSTDDFEFPEQLARQSSVHLRIATFRAPVDTRA